MNTKKYLSLSILLATLIFAATSCMVYAGTGSIRIDPPLPIMTGSPAEFDVWVQGSDDVNDPHVFLAMTESCYLALSGNVVVDWGGGSVTVSGWTKETSNGKKVPSGSSNGAAYTVASIKSHLETSEPIYWAIASILGGPMEVGETYHITITMTSTDPCMLVYIMGKSDGSSLLDMRVPPTIPGFMIPELPMGTISSMLTMAGAYVLTKLRKK